MMIYIHIYTFIVGSKEKRGMEKREREGDGGVFLKSFKRIKNRYKNKNG